MVAAENAWPNGDDYGDQRSQQDASATENLLVQNQTQAYEYYCPNCFAKVVGDEDECRNCGFSIMDQIDPAAAPENQDAAAAWRYQEPPLSYGEQLILEMTLRHKGKPFDRQRQAELATPRRRHNSDEEKFGASELLQDNRRLGVKETRAMLERLSKPRGASASLRPVTPGEALLLEKESRRSGRNRALDVAACIERLTAPRAPPQLSASSAEQMMFATASRLGPNRTCDGARLAELARPKKRAASSASWGVRLEDTIQHKGLPMLIEAQRSQRYAQVPDATSNEGTDIAAEHLQARLSKQEDLLAQVRNIRASLLEFNDKVMCSGQTTPTTTSRPGSSWRVGVDVSLSHSQR